MLTLIKGRPADTSGRLDKELRCYDMLERLGIEFWQVDHPAAFTMEACLEIDQALGTAMCKNLLLTNRQHTAWYLLLMPGDKVFKTKELSAQIGSARLSFASGEEMERFLDITPGSLSMLGLMNDREGNVRLLVDRDLLSQEFQGLHPLVNTSSLRIRTKDLFGAFLKETGHTMQVVELVGE